ncbi:MAG: Eco57I restriction-modification methylase domain-containing protein [Planctomycetaceae bacterium]|jgi:superfamily II DNA or RNA helicase|nr:Eco57I restriction-modification methylase domain-containing protein [Planctomycetaceae bacterium]
MTHAFENTFAYNAVYVYAIPDENHRGRLKIGQVTLPADFHLTGFCESRLNDICRKRIDEQTKTADVVYELLLCEIAAADSKRTFTDSDVHNVLMRSGYERKATRRGVREWFDISLETAKQAINAVKEGRSAITGGTVTGNTVAGSLADSFEAFPFRDSQRAAVSKTVKRFRQQKNKKQIRFLWNCKMRFGKTTAAMQTAKEMGFAKTLVITHRPAVQDSWFEDFQKIFQSGGSRRDNNCQRAGNCAAVFGSKTKGETIEHLLRQDKPFIYFASIQDLRGSEQHIKNEDILLTDWDFLIIDEAHEGTQTDKWHYYDNLLSRKYTLSLSGTPFNLLENDDWDEDDTYSWTYVDEQKAKTDWDTEHTGEPNPYAELPQLTIFNYELNKHIQHSDFAEDIEDKAFNFKEFFRVDENDTFVHEKYVKKFLGLLTQKSESLFPYSTQEYRSYIKHTLWMLPGVKEAKALAELLRHHSVFSQFGIANVAGNEEIERDALHTVREIIKNNDYSITLTCGKLTLGVNVPEWTAVFYLANGKSATQYLQTVFRCQTPYSVNGQIKTQCYVFDFAPDRTLQIAAQAAALNTGAGETNSEEQKEAVRAFLNFCPVIAVTDGKMKRFNLEGMLLQLKKAAIQRVTKNGFDDPNVYNDKLLKLDGIELQEFENLQKIVGRTQQTEKINQLTINALGFDKEEFEKARQAEKKPKKERTAEEEEILKKKNEAFEQRRTAISILRGISIRIPMLLFGLDSPADEITVKNFVEMIDDASWEEFMPKGVTKEMFRKFSKYYDEEVFIGAGRNIRRKAEAADTLLPFERIEMIAEIFAAFKNPDKETVLTPWRVVNNHLSDTLGGSNFNEKDETGLPVQSCPITIADVWNKNTKILEINSKSGLYPLLAAYNLYYAALRRQKVSAAQERQVFQERWNAVLAANIFVVCKTPMAASITKRTLAGFSAAKVNAVTIAGLTDKFDDKEYNFANDLTKKFNTKENMQFDIVIGNPPYQELTKKGNTSNNRQQAVPLYHKFVQQAKKFNPKYLSLVIPARWYSGGMGLNSFRKEMLNDNRLRILHDYIRADGVFPTVKIKGGVCYFLWDRDNPGLCNVYSHSEDGTVSVSERPLLEEGCDTFIRYNEALPILQKIKEKGEESLTAIIQPLGIFGFPSNFTRYGAKKFDGSVTIYGNKFTGYVKKEQIQGGLELINKYKVLLPEAVGNGGFDLPFKPVITDRQTCCTFTYIVMGHFDSKTKAENLAGYLQTKFVRFLVGLRKITQHATRKEYSFVPLQDFDRSWTDAELYAKYTLTADETAFIEKMIRTESPHRR